MTTDLSPVHRPVSTARGLPNAHYTDPAVIAEENEAVLASEWAGLAVASDVPEAGDAKPLEFLGEPLLLLRDRNGKVRVFHNVCRHRGMILVSEPRKIEGALRCPYHSWCYSLEGKLVATPHVGGPGLNAHQDVDRDLLGLIEVRSHIWRDIVFINLNSQAAPFEQVNAELIARWAEFDQPLFHGGTDSYFSLQVETNWKLAVENYCESYHLPWVHPGLNSYSRLEDHYNIESIGKYSGQGTLVYRQLHGDDGAVFPDFEALNSKWETAAEYITVYPNVLLGVHRDHAFCIILEQLSPTRTLEHIHLYYASDDIDAALRVQNSALWKEVFEEDVFVVQGMQNGRRARAFDGGRFSPAMDGPTHCFHQWVAERVTRQRQNQAAE